MMAMGRPWPSSGVEIAQIYAGKAREKSADILIGSNDRGAVTASRGVFSGGGLGGLVQPRLQQPKPPDVEKHTYG